MNLAAPQRPGEAIAATDVRGLAPNSPAGASAAGRFLGRAAQIAGLAGGGPGDRLLEAMVAPSYLRSGIRLRSLSPAWGEPGRLDGRHVVLTGATRGIGRAAAKAIVSLGASLTILARSPEGAEALRAELSEKAGQQGRAGADIDVVLADLAEFAGVEEAAEAILARHGSVDVLAHNAGGLHRTWGLGPSGVEQTVASQVVSVWLLTTRLAPALAAVGGRVLVMTSAGMYTVRHEIDRLTDPGPEHYDGRTAYARAKRAQVVLMRGWSRQSDPGVQPVRFHAVHPGWVRTEGLAEGLPGFARVTGPALRSPEQGADTLVWLAAAPEARHTDGRLWFDRQPRPFDRLPRTVTPDSEIDEEFESLVTWCQRSVAGTAD